MFLKIGEVKFVIFFSVVGLCLCGIVEELIFFVENGFLILLILVCIKL